MAALEISAKKPSENVQVMLQHDSSEYLLCTLHNSLMQQPLDLNFATGEQVSFSLNGSGIVHLTGYLIPDDEEGPFEESFSESDDEGMSMSYVSKFVNIFINLLILNDFNGPITIILHYIFSEAPSLVDTSADESILEQYIFSCVYGEKICFLNIVFMTFNLVGKRKADASHRKSKKLKLSDSYVDDEEDENLEEDDEESPTKKVKTTAPEKPQKAASAPNTPAAKKIKVKQELNTSKQDGKSPKTPNQQSPGKQNGKAKQDSQKKNQQAAGTPSEKAPQTVSIGKFMLQTSNVRLTKKKKKKKNKEAETTTSTTPKKRVVAGGTIVEDIKVGHGPEAKPGKMASVYYVGVLAKSNKRFDSCTEGKPFRFKLNQGEVIKGWDVGVTGMKVGGKRKITVPASQAYGNVKQGPIPPNSTLVFEVELKAVS
ncbi:unnamed protein product [Lymnaea stagnalis]|uniref:FK506-binding protein n=1 Tax=Lymnaea stagnalis TaxID=6523 RepID=A0AAV2HMR1_LYMST